MLEDFRRQGFIGKGKGKITTVGPHYYSSEKENRHNASHKGWEEPTVFVEADDLLV
jgi:hypothetical protein